MLLKVTYLYTKILAILLLIIVCMGVMVSCSRTYERGVVVSEPISKSESSIQQGSETANSNSLEQIVIQSVESMGVQVDDLKVISDLTKVQVKPFDLHSSECKEVCIVVNSTSDIQTCYAVILPQELSRVSVKSKIEDFVSQQESISGQSIEYTALEAGDYLIFGLTDKAANFSKEVLKALDY